MTRIFASALLVVMCFGLANCESVSKNEFEAGRDALASSKAEKRRAVSECIKRFKNDSPVGRRNTAALFNIPLSSYESTLCSRLYNAYASGRISYQDYVALGSSSADNSRFIRIMQGR